METGRGETGKTGIDMGDVTNDVKDFRKTVKN